MSQVVNPFVDPVVVRGHLYAAAARLARRTGALHRAKVAGRHAAQVIAELAMSTMPPQQWLTVVDVGCGRGTTTRALADQLRPAQLIALDVSPAVLAAARVRLSGYGPVRFVCADCHHLPLRDASCHLVVAAFCLYHSARPVAVVGEIARCLTARGAAILVTKSADSYRELDELVAASGLDPQATMRPSLYEAVHSGNLAELAASALDVRQVVHEEHRFRFTDLAHAAEYLVTSPKYVLPEWLRDSPGALAAALQNRLSERPVTTTSTVTYVVAAPRVISRGCGSSGVTPPAQSARLCGVLAVRTLPGTPRSPVCCCGRIRLLAARIVSCWRVFWTPTGHRVRSASRNVALLSHRGRACATPARLYAWAGF